MKKNKRIRALNFRAILLILSVLFAALMFPGCKKSGGSESNNEVKPTCTLYIECTKILENMDDFDTDKLEVLPESGVILEKCEVEFTEGESVYELLMRETRSRKIHMDASYTPVYDSAYVKGINNIYEFDCGEGSGWTYSVNGVFPNYGCSKYTIKAGDAIEWHYTCDYGRDVGCEFPNS